MRALVTFVFAALAGFCGYGFLAAGEPGTDPGWRVGYGALGLAALLFAWHTHRGGDRRAAG